MFNSIIQTFQSIILSGTSKLNYALLAVPPILLGIDVIYTLIQGGLDDLKVIIKDFLRKCMIYSIFFAIVYNYVDIVMFTKSLFIELANIFYVDKIPTSGILDVDSIVKTLNNISVKILIAQDGFSWYQIPYKILNLLLWGISLYCLFLIIKELIINYLSYLLVACFAPLFIVLGFFSYTREYATNGIIAIIKAGFKLFVMLALVGIATQILSLFDLSTIFGIGFAPMATISFLMYYAILATLVSQSDSISNAILSGSAANLESSGALKIMGAMATLATFASPIAGKAAMAEFNAGIGAAGSVISSVKKNNGVAGALKAGMNALKKGTGNVAVGVGATALDMKAGGVGYALKTATMGTLKGGLSGVKMATKMTTKGVASLYDTSVNSKWGNVARAGLGLTSSIANLGSGNGSVYNTIQAVEKLQNSVKKNQ